MSVKAESTPNWRPAYEWISAAAFAAAAALTIKHQGSPMLDELLPVLAVGLLVMAFYRLAQAIRNWKGRYALAGKPLEFVTPEYVRAKVRRYPDQLWLGWGFEWGIDQRQKNYDLMKLKYPERIIPLLLRPFKKSPQKGSPYLHGMSATEEDILIPLKDLEGHTFIPATTGAIKTRLLSLIAMQEILRDKSAVIIIDPKGDTELLELTRWACRAAGREDDFCFFHPAFPTESVRLDLLKNWTTTTESASRVAEMMGGSAESAPFKAFGWEVINNLVQAMLAVGERPQLVSIRHYIESGADHLLLNVIRAYIQERGEDPDRVIQSYQSAAHKARGRSASTPKETIAAVMYYKAEIQPNAPSQGIDGLLTMYEHDAAHFTKMIATLLPILAMLTSDELKELLSPDYTNTDDPRPILDNARIVRTGKVFYMGLHSMPDATVSATIGSLMLADLAAVLGERYARQELKPRITLLLDEANEIVNESLVSIMNKGRGAGLTCYMFTQTVSDFIAKYGAEAPARQLLGNANNAICGRTTDKVTSEYIQEKCGGATIQMSREHDSTSAMGERRDITNYNASYGTMLTDQADTLVTPDAISELPDLEYFAAFVGRRIIKGRIPIVVSK